MSAYRCRPLVVEAWEFTHEPGAMPSWVAHAVLDGHILTDRKSLVIYDQAGTMVRLLKGDFVLRRAPDVFEGWQREAFLAVFQSADAPADVAEAVEGLLAAMRAQRADPHTIQAARDLVFKG